MNIRNFGSVWDMLQFELYKLTDAAAELAELKELYRICQSRKVPVNLTEKYRAVKIKAFDNGIEITRQLELPLSADALRRSKALFLKLNAASAIESAEVAMLVSALRDFDISLYRETSKQRTFLILESSVELYEQTVPVFGAKVSSKFAKISTDISEAAKCLALDRHTACVFHLMRVMEFGIKCLGKKLKIEIDVEKETWYQIEQHINKIIAAMPNSISSEQKKKQKYASASAGLSSVRLAWRNDVMHPKATYTEEEARRIMDHVGGFLDSLCPLI